MRATKSHSTASSSVEEQLVREHLPLVHYAANEVASRLPRHVAREDLVAAGMLGLAQAARSFDEAHGVTFARYARTRIKGAIIDELRSRDWASRSTRSKARSLQATTERLTAQLSRTPSLLEVAAELGLATDEVEKLMDDVHRATVLNYDSIVTDGDGEVALPGMHESPEDVLATRERIAYLRDAVTSLPERLRHVVVGYFFEERPMQELADELGVSESRISQMRAEALELLKEGVESQLEPEAVVAPDNPNGRIARRKAAYYASIAAASDFRTRLAATPVSVPDRVAAAVNA